MTMPTYVVEVEALRRERAAAGIRSLAELTVEEARTAERLELQSRTVEREAVALVVDRSIDGIPVRCYLPESAQPLPALVWFPGGGWVLGSVETTDAVCRRIANTTPCAVVAVDYRRAPEYPFPAAVEDAYAATTGVVAESAALGIDAGRVAVGGASAGGNLAAVVAQLCRDRRGPALALQLLVYPATDFRSDTPSRREALDPYFFNRDDLAWCWSHYLAADEDGDDPRASPLHAPDCSRLPPALVLTAEHDPLRDEAEQYARRLASNGVAVDLVRYDGVPHGFFSMADTLAAAADARERAATALARALRTIELTGIGIPPHGTE
jgi:acetyl esterase/lipase